MHVGTRSLKSTERKTGNKLQRNKASQKPLKPYHSGCGSHYKGKTVSPSLKVSPLHSQASASVWSLVRWRVIFLQRTGQPKKQSCFGTLRWLRTMARHYGEKTLMFGDTHDNREKPKSGRLYLICHSLKVRNFLGSKIWKYLEDERAFPGSQTAKPSMTSRGHWYPKKARMIDRHQPIIHFRLKYQLRQRKGKITVQWTTTTSAAFPVVGTPASGCLQFTTHSEIFLSYFKMFSYLYSTWYIHLILFNLFSLLVTGVFFLPLLCLLCLFFLLFIPYFFVIVLLYCTLFKF